MELRLQRSLGLLCLLGLLMASPLVRARPKTSPCARLNSRMAAEQAQDTCSLVGIHQQNFVMSRLQLRTLGTG